MSSIPDNCAGLKPERLARVMDRIEHGLHEPLQIAHLAEAACLSPFHFARMFKHTTGKSPHAFVTEKRMALAKELLASTPLSIAEVSRRAGYRTQAHFTGVFRQYTGVTPRRFREGDRPE
jgi:AraC family transcriptional regulator